MQEASSEAVNMILDRLQIATDGSRNVGSAGVGGAAWHAKQHQNGRGQGLGACREDHRCLAAGGLGGPLSTRKTRAPEVAARLKISTLHKWSAEGWEDEFREVDKVSSRGSITLTEGMLVWTRCNVKDRDQRRVQS